jgi:hypothetical protein
VSIAFRHQVPSLREQGRRLVEVTVRALVPGEGAEGIPSGPRVTQLGCRRSALAGQVVRLSIVAQRHQQPPLVTDGVDQPAAGRQAAVQLECLLDQRHADCQPVTITAVLGGPTHDLRPCRVVEASEHALGDLAQLGSSVPLK